MYVRPEAWPQGSAGAGRLAQPPLLQAAGRTGVTAMAGSPVCAPVVRIFDIRAAFWYGSRPLGEGDAPTMATNLGVRFSGHAVSEREMALI